MATQVEASAREAIMAADFHNAGNLKMIIDRNRIQNDDFVSKQMEIRRFIVLN